MIAGKDSKVRGLEEENRKIHKKKKTLLKEVKLLKENLGAAIEQIEKLSKTQRVGFSSKSRRTTRKNQSDRVVQTLTNTLRSKSEILANIAKMRRKDKELETYKERLSIKEMDLEIKNKEFKGLEKENKNMARAMEKAEKMFRKEMTQLINKIEGSNELLNLQKERRKLTKNLAHSKNNVKDLSEELKQKKDSIDSLRTLKDTYEKRLKKANENIDLMQKKIKKLEEGLKEGARQSENLILFKEKYQEMKKESSVFKGKFDKLNVKIFELKNDVQRKDTLIGQMRVKLQEDKGEVKVDEETVKALEMNKKTVKIFLKFFLD